MTTAEPTTAEMVETGQCPHESIRPTPYAREYFCFDCEDFVDVITGALAPDAKERVTLDDWIDAVESEPFTHVGWSRVLDAALIFGMGNPNRPTIRAIFRAHRAWVKACERAGEGAY